MKKYLYSEGEVTLKFTPFGLKSAILTAGYFAQSLYWLRFSEFCSEIGANGKYAPIWLGFLVI